jgi:hypothetical protein
VVKINERQKIYTKNKKKKTGSMKKYTIWQVPDKSE